MAEVTKPKAALRITLAVFDGASLDQVLKELMMLAEALGSKQSVQYNGKWMYAEPGNTADEILRNYAGAQYVGTQVYR
jgi:hypothetical protein